MAPSDDDHVLFARMDTLMAARRRWRDPEETISMLARRLHGPAKTLSIALNRVTRQNILRYVNGHRIAAGRASMQKGASETEAMLDAGFLTKFNFNREFRRITGKTPATSVARAMHRAVFAVIASFFAKPFQNHQIPLITLPVGGVAEWSNAPVLKTDVGGSLPWVRIPPPPPLALTKAFSRSGCGRIFPLFSEVMRVGLLTGAVSKRPESVLSGPIFSRPVAFAVLVNFPQPTE